MISVHQFKALILFCCLVSVFSSSSAIARGQSCIKLYSSQRTSSQNWQQPIEDVLFKSTKDFASLKKPQMSILCRNMFSFKGICLRLVVDKLLPKAKKNPIEWDLPESVAPFVDMNRLYSQGTSPANDNFNAFSGKVKARSHYPGSKNKLLQLSIESESQFIEALELLLAPSQLITKIRRSELDSSLEQLLFDKLDKVNYRVGYAFSSDWIVFIPQNLDKASLDLYSQLRSAAMTNKESFISILSSAAENLKMNFNKSYDYAAERQQVFESDYNLSDQRSSSVEIISTIAHSGQKGMLHYTHRQSLPSILSKAALLPATHLTNEDMGLSKKVYGFDGKIYASLTPESLMPMALSASQFSSGNVKLLSSVNDNSTRYSVESLDRIFLYFDLQMLENTPSYHIARDGMSQYGNYVPEVDFLYDPIKNVGSASRLKTFLEQGRPGEVVFHTDSSGGKGLSLEKLKGIWVAAPMYQTIVNELKAKGIESFNGIPIEQFVIAIPIKEKFIGISSGKLIFEGK